ncbi:MAG: AhpC/TSA family protein, partial [Proteobacteria bacterium]|nr:AhpC/TSA family protein [Pseudomonadota bacterium]
MSLEEKLATTRAGAATRIPPERQAIMHRATDDLRRSGIMDRIVKPGMPAPSFELENH